MDARSYTAEERRAANQVWAAAGAYGFEPLFLARNTDGTIDFYMNCVVGLVHKYYGDDLLRDLFATWDGDLRESQLDDLTWLYLESAVYLLELPRRPVLSELRRAHADYFFGIQYKLSRQEWMAKNQLVYTMQADRWRTVQGRHPPVMTPYESRLAEALSPAQPPQPGQLKGELLGLFARFALFDGKIRHRAGLHLHLEGLLASLATKTLPTQMIKTDRLTVEHSGSVEAGGSGPTADKRLAHITLRQNAAEDRAYIESCFGRSLYPPERLRKAEQALCTGAHLGCRLWFASGVPSPEQAPTPEAKHLAEQAQLQADRNRAYYAKNRALHRSVVLRLTEQIRNCILVHQQPNARIARSGALDPERVWRAPLLNDSRVFRCAEEENQPSFTVDLLLDASASRLHCQEVIAAQGTILAQSLAACGIPVRVSSFCSLRGYTVLRVLKGFADKSLQGDPKPVSDETVPQVVFSFPEAASVGLALDDAKSCETIINPQETAYPMLSNSRMLMSGEGGSMTIVSGAMAGAPDVPLVLGVHIVSPLASDLIAEAEQLVGNRVPLAAAARLIHPHPTFSESFGEALLKADGRPLHTR